MRSLNWYILSPCRLGMFFLYHSLFFLLLLSLSQIIGLITKESTRQAFKNGVTSNDVNISCFETLFLSVFPLISSLTLQIITYLNSFVHPQMKKLQTEVPSNVKGSHS
jgi:hypothetical protein